VPSFNLSTIGRAFKVAAAQTWNALAALPQDVTTSPTFFFVKDLKFIHTIILVSTYIID